MSTPNDDKAMLQIDDDIAIFPLPWPLNTVSLDIVVIGNGNGPASCTVGGTSRYFRKFDLTIENEIRGIKFDTKDEIDLKEFEKLKTASKSWIEQQLRMNE